jgi:hypothetical protein
MPGDISNFHVDCVVERKQMITSMTGKGKGQEHSTHSSFLPPLQPPPPTPLVHAMTTRLGYEVANQQLLQLLVRDARFPKHVTALFPPPCPPPFPPARQSHTQAWL